MDSKPATASKTIWVNVITLVIALLSTAAANEWVAAHPQTVSFIVATIAALNIVLRFITNQPLRLL